MSNKDTPWRRMPPGQLSYPNVSLGETARMTDIELDCLQRRSSTSDSFKQKDDIGLARQVVLVVCLMTGFLFSTIDTCIVSIPLVTISKELNNFMLAPWVVLSYLLTYMAFATGIAQLSDIYGRRNMLLFSWAIFVVFSMGAGASQSMTALIVCRAFQGLGGSGLYSIAQISIVEIGPGHRPSIVGAMMGGTLAVSFICGPLFGGLITERSTWRWIFYINIPFGLAVIGALVACWPHEPHAANIFSWQAFTSVDLVGGTCLLFASSLLIYGIQSAGAQSHDWSNPEIIAALTIAGVCWVLIFCWESLLAHGRYPHIRPLFPVRLASNRVYMATLIVTLLTGLPFIPLTIIVPERFQIVHGDRPLIAGVRLLPLLGACAVGSFASGVVCSRRNFTSFILLFASVLQLVGLGLMSTLDDPDASILSNYGYQSLFGFGTGLTFSAATIIATVQSSAGRDLAVANGAMAQARVFGGCVGISLCTVIFNSHFNSMLQDKISDQALKDLHRSPTASIRWDHSDRELVRSVYATAYSAELKLMLCAIGITFIASIFTYERNPTPVHTAAKLTKERLEKDSLSDRDDSDTGSLRSTYHT